MTIRAVTDPFRYGVLNALTQQVADLEMLRMSLSSRKRLLIQPADIADADGLCRGLGLPLDDPLIVGPIDTILSGVAELEKDAIKTVERYMRDSAWGPWLAQAHGVGAKQLARLLGATNDPCWHARGNRYRLVSELWAYCGLHVVPDEQTGAGVAPRRRRGQQSNWSEEARKRTWLIATSIVKAGGPYRAVYDNAKSRYAGRVHDAECVRCGPSGKPARPGDPLSKAHIHARALRATGKRVLVDLHYEACRHRGVDADTATELAAAARREAA